MKLSPSKVLLASSAIRKDAGEVKITLTEKGLEENREGVIQSI